MEDTEDTAGVVVGLERERGCRISGGLLALAKGVGSSVLVLLHNRREDLANEVPVLDSRGLMDRHTPEAWQVASRIADSLAGAGGTCFVLAKPHSPAEP